MFGFPKFSLATLFALGLAVGAPVFAETSKEFEGVLAQVPVGTITAEQSYVQIEFGDPIAASRVEAARTEAGQPSADYPLSILRGFPSGFAESLVRLDAGERIEGIGLALPDFGPTLLIQSLPDELIAVRLRPEARLAMQETVAARDGIRIEDRGGVAVAIDAFDDYSINIIDRNPTNPFGGNLGVAQRFAFTDWGVFWSRGMPAIDALLAGGTPLSEDPRLLVMMGVLDEQTDNEGMLRHAYGAIAEADRVSEFSEVLLGTSYTTLSAAMVFDLGSATQDVGLMVLTFAPGTDVNALADRFQDAFENDSSVTADRPFAELFDNAPQVTAYGGSTPAISFQASEDVPSGPVPINRPASTFLNFMVSRELATMLGP